MGVAPMTLLLVFLVVLGVGTLVLVGLVAMLSGSRERYTAPPPRETPSAELIREQRRAYCDARNAILASVYGGELMPEPAAEELEALAETHQRGPCPLCGEAIRLEARKCPHCRSFLDRPRSKTGPVTKSADRVLAGVCGGIAEYVGTEAHLIRLVTVLAALVTGALPVVIAYIVAAIVLPEPC